MTDPGPQAPRAPSERITQDPDLPVSPSSRPEGRRWTIYVCPECGEHERGSRSDEGDNYCYACGMGDVKMVPVEVVEAEGEHPNAIENLLRAIEAVEPNLNPVAGVDYRLLAAFGTIRMVLAEARAALDALQEEPEDVNLLEDGHTQPPAMRQEAWATGEPPLEPCGPRGDEGRSVRPSSGEPGNPGPLTPEEATPTTYTVNLDADPHEWITVVLTCLAGEGPHKPPHDTWAVRYLSYCLNDEGDWEWEPIPSSRDDEFLARTRWTKDEAIRRAKLRALASTEGDG